MVTTLDHRLPWCVLYIPSLSIHFRHIDFAIFGPSDLPQYCMRHPRFLLVVGITTPESNLLYISRFPNNNIGICFDRGLLDWLQDEQYAIRGHTISS
jgi:hypothetical protein